MPKPTNPASRTAQSARRGFELSTTIGAAPADPIETEITRLENETKLLKAKQARVEAVGAAAAGLVGGTSGAPEGTLTLDDTAGALDPWVARRELGNAVAVIATEVKNAVMGAEASPAAGKAATSGQRRVERPPGSVRVLVTDDPALFNGDWEAQLLGRRLEAQCQDLTTLKEGVAAATRDVGGVVRTWVDADETTQDKRRPLSHHVVGLRNLLTATAAPEPGVAAQDDASESEVEAGPAAAASAESPLALALQLVALTRTDTTVTGRTVTVGDRELVMGVAAALAGTLGDACTVVADGMTTVSRDSPLLVAMDRRAELRAALAHELAQLDGRLAVAQAAAAFLEGTPALEEEEETHEDDGQDEAEDSEGDTGDPRDDHDDRDPRRETLSPADAKLLRAVTEASLKHLPLLTQVSERVLALDAEMAGWLSATASGGASAMLAAAARERLHRSADGYTHVLLVENNGLATDVVTRKSLAGTSGRLTHLGSASVSWLLVETTHGATVGGGHSSSAGRLVLDVASGRTAGSSIDLQAAQKLPRDPYASFELAVKVFLIVGALALVIFAMTALLNLVGWAEPDAAPGATYRTAADLQGWQIGEQRGAAYRADSAL